MGFMSRRVVPACGTFCICCPSLRSRSRQPVKRYKKLIADVFQDQLPNDRKISKLCDYASRNPLRIPKIATSLEQRGYKELRNERFSSIRIVMAAYIKLFSACKGQMPLFAISAIQMIKTLLQQTQHDDMRVVGCDALFEFVYNQIDGTYIHQLDALVPSLCSLARETGERSQLQLRSAGLRALSALIWFMGEHSYIPSTYDHVVSAIMENYEPSFASEESDVEGNAYHYWMNEVVKGERRVPKATLTDAFTKLSSQKEGFISGKLPVVFAHVCIDKIAQLAKEATTARRFLEPMFCYFDLGKHWSPVGGLASAVLHQFLHSIENLGSNCVLPQFLVRHLDHKNVNQRPQVKSDIVKVVASLVQKSRSEATVVEVSVLNDILRHLRNSFQTVVDLSDCVELGWNEELQLGIQECVQVLVEKLGDPVPIYEMMALNLENLSSVAAISRNLISSLMVLVHVVVSLPRLTQFKQSFPDALIHQLSMAMVHSDTETRVGVHNIFGTLLLPAPVWHDENCVSGAFGLLMKNSKTHLTTSASTFTSVKMMLETLRKYHSVAEQSIEMSTNGKLLGINGNVMTVSNTQKQESSAINQARHQKELELTDGKFLVTDGNVRTVSNTQKQESLKINQAWPKEEADLKVSGICKSDNKGLEMTPVRLTGDQATLILSSMWSELNMENNLPANYEAIFATFSLVLLFSPPTVSNKDILVYPLHKIDSDQNIFVQVVQLALSLRTTALQMTSHLCPSRQRSLFVLSMAMLLFTSRIYDIPGITSQMDTLVEKGLVDPYLDLDEYGLRVATSRDTSYYASSLDTASASEFLAAVRTQNEFSTEAVVTLVLSNFSASFGMELSQLREELRQPFSPDKGLAFSLDKKLNKVDMWTAVQFNRNISFDEVVEPNEDLISDISHTDLPQLLRTPIHTVSSNVIGVSQLLESALETAGQVAGVSVSSSPLPYSDVAMRCEAFGTSAGRKIPVWMNLGGSGRMGGLQKENKRADGKYMGYVNRNTVTLNPLFISNHESWETLQLPPVSHYDNFLRAAGC